MATAKKAAPAKAAKPVTKQAAAKAPAKPAAKAAAAPAAVKPVKDVFNKTSLVAHVAGQAGVEPKVAKAVLGALDAAILGALNKKGAGEFTLPGLLKIGVQKVPAKKARKGIDPFTKQERMFAAKPASVKIKVRALKKLKDAAL
jgi:nucleoid DNA-binding protein